MPTIIETPNVIADPLYVGSLAPDILEGRPAAPTTHDRPSILLGRPVCLGQFGIDLPMPEIGASLSDRNAYYLVRLSCSFRPPSDGTLTFASLSVYLRPRVGREPELVALDLFPMRVLELQEGEIKVGVMHDLRLTQINETGQAGIEAMIRYNHLAPEIMGIGVGRSDPGWEFSPHADCPLWGSKFLYLILQKPQHVESVRMTLDAAAEIQAKQNWFGFRAVPPDRDRLSVVICDRADADRDKAAVHAKYPSVESIDGTQLRRMLVDRLSLSELRNLCFDLGVDDENLPGYNTKGDLARELLRYLERRQRLADLLIAWRAIRPDIDWDGLAA